MRWAPLYLILVLLGTGDGTRPMTSVQDGKEEHLQSEKNDTLHHLNETLLLEGFFEWIELPPTPLKIPTPLELHTSSGITSSHPMLMVWGEHLDRSVFAQRTRQQALVIQTNMLRDYILRQMYASTETEPTIIYLPPYATWDSLSVVKRELREHGFTYHTTDYPDILLVDVPHSEEEK